MTAFQAAWVCPIERPPIPNGIVEIEDGVIVGIREPGAGKRASADGSPILDPGSRQLDADHLVVLGPPRISDAPTPERTRIMGGETRRAQCTEFFDYLGLR